MENHSQANVCSNVFSVVDKALPFLGIADRKHIYDMCGIL